MRNESPEKSIQLTQMDDESQQFVREAGQSKVRLVLVDANGEQVAEIRRIDRDAAGIWAGYDPGAARDAWRRSAGTLRGIDVEALLADLKAAREQDSPGRPA